MKKLKISRNVLIIYLITIIGLAVSSGIAANTDSLLTLLQVYESDTNRVRVLNKLADYNLSVDYKISEEYAQEALILARILGDNIGVAESLFILTYANIYAGTTDSAISNAHQAMSVYQVLDNQNQIAFTHYLLGYLNFKKGVIKKAKDHYQSCLVISKSTGYKKGKSLGFTGLGDIFESNGEYAKALNIYQESLEFNVAEDDQVAMVTGYNNLGRINEELGNLESALKHYLESLRLAEDINRKQLIVQSLNNIGIFYSEQKNYEKAEEYINKGVALAKLENNVGLLANALQTKAGLFKDLKKYEDAIMLYNEVLKIRKDLGDKRGLSFTYNHLGQLYEILNNQEKAWEYNYKSLMLRKELGFKKGIAMSLRHLGAIHISMQEYTKALDKLNEGLLIAQEIKSFEERQKINFLLAKAYSKIGNYKKAYEHKEKYVAIKDSLFTLDQNKQFANLQTLYETEKKEKQIAIQINGINELEINNTKLTSQRNYIFGGAILIVIFTIFGYRFNKIRKERNDKKEFSKLLLLTQEEERKRIARDLHDGVGQSLLLIKKQMESTHVTTLENQEMITTTLEEVRSISRDLHPFQLDKFGLTSTIEGMIEKVGKSTELFMTKEIQNIDGSLLKSSEIHLFRTVQESLNNIIKHAEATAAKVIISNEEANIKVTIQDNGKGFDPELTIVKSKSMGFKTMYERIFAIGGKIDIQKGKFKGTVIKMTIPKCK